MKTIMASATKAKSQAPIYNTWFKWQ